MNIQKLALDLMDWNNGQGSGLYAVASTLHSGGQPDTHSIERAIFELRQMRTLSKFPDTLSLEDEQWCRFLADQLEELFADRLPTVERAFGGKTTLGNVEKPH